jgi:phosphoserine phosphatase
MPPRLAFVVLEDVLLDAARFQLDLALARFLALNAATPGERARRLLKLAADLPAYALSGKVNGRLTDELAAHAYAGYSLDRLHVLGELAARDLLAPRLRSGTAAFLGRLCTDGFSVVVLSALPEPMVAPLVAQLRVPGLELAANRLASLRGRASGEYTVPGTSAHERAARAREWVARRSTTLADAAAWAGRAADAPLLEAVGHPHVMHAEKPLVELAAERGSRSRRSRVARSSSPAAPASSAARSSRRCCAPPRTRA